MAVRIRLLQLIFFVSLALMAAFPVLRTHFLLETTNDAFYYYARTNEVLKGNWQIGNPFYYEHRHDLGISFIVPDWLSAIPGSFFVWPLITAVLIFLVLKTLEVKGWMLYVGTVFCFITSLYSIVRPTSMQTIFPFFLLFFYALLKYLQSKKNTLVFVIAASITFYIYPYLWQVVLITLASLILMKKASTKFLLIPLLALPALTYLWLQLHAPYYWETMARIGLVYTHIPTLDSGLYFLTMSLPVIFLRKRLPFVVLYIAFTGVLFSSVITGRELEISNHIIRFIALYGAIGIVYLISISKRFFLLAIIWIFFFYKNFLFLVSVINPTVPVVKIPPEVNRAKVVKVKGPLLNYIPFMTNAYVLFHPNGLLHLMSSDEAVERYLVWKYPEKITEGVLIEDFRNFVGTGPAVHVTGHYNYHVRICRLLQRKNCGETKDAYEYYGKEYFQGLIKRYESDIYPNISQYYKKYHVDLVIN